MTAKKWKMAESHLLFGKKLKVIARNIRKPYLVKEIGLAVRDESER